MRSNVFRLAKAEETGGAREGSGLGPESFSGSTPGLSTCSDGIPSPSSPRVEYGAPPRGAGEVRSVLTSDRDVDSGYTLWIKLWIP